MGTSEKKSYCCCSCCTAVVLIGGLICAGIIFACLGAASIPLFDDLYVDIVKKQLVLKKGNEAYNNWQVPPAPVYMQFYIFNYTNVHDIITNTSKPKPTVQQIGPYSYREYRVNEVLTEDDYQITFLQNNTYVFDPTTSCEQCTENDTLYAPNIPVITVMSKIKDLNITNPGFFKNVALEAANAVLNADSDVSLFKKLSVRELLWGYHDPFLNRLSTLESLLELFKLDLPYINPFVALQYNGTKGALLAGNATTLTGKKNINDVQKITKWKGESSVAFWRTKYGDMINGTDGTRFHPFLTSDEQIYIFNNQLCRSIYLDYERDTSLMDISLLRYTTTDMVFANYSINPDNKAFCGPTTCWGAGLLEVSQCQEGNPPVFISSPHFYQGAQYLIDAIDGLHPQKSLHETFISIEPVTGLAMDAHKRLQINILARPSLYFDVMKPLRDEFNFLPVLFVHEGGSIDKPNADKFKSEVLSPKMILKWLSYGLMIIGGIIILSALIFGVVVSKRKDDNYKRFNDEDSKGNGKEANGYTDDVYVS